VRTRALNSLGWSAWSPPSCASCETKCTTKAPPAAVFNILTVVIPLSALLLLAFVCAVMAYTGSLAKIVAPRLRRKQNQEVLADFVSSDMTPMEEQDPELVINPIFVHKMKRERERQRKAKQKKGTGMGRTGGLARLNIQFNDQPRQVDEKKIEMNAVDHYLERERGIIDEHKAKSAYEREVAGKALAKNTKNAAAKSAVQADLDKKRELQEARTQARDAVRAGATAGLLDDEAYENPRVQQPKSHTSVL